MGFALRAVLIGLVLLGAIGFQKFRELTKPLPAPKLDLNEYWGPGDKAKYKEDASIVPFKVSYSEKVIEDLRKQLNRSITFHEPLEGVGFEYGFNTNKLKQVINYWRDDYLPKWKTREEYLSKYPHYTTQIQGLHMHYIHLKQTQSTKGKKVFPVILIHGWPGSVREFYEIIPKLIANDKSDYVFEVVVPSLPGYGWSQAASKRGLGTAEMAVILRNLMIRLGYNKFLVQGGDWGSLIGSNIATLFPENVIAYHSNMCAMLSPLSYLKSYFASHFPSYFVAKEYEDFFFPLSTKFLNTIEESGYFHIQATKSDTIGSALTANPVGLAAYILEKFSTWTNVDYRKLKDGGLEKRYTLDALLDNVMIYYLTNSITTSQRLYAENFAARERDLQMDRVQATVPYGCARFRHDLLFQMDWILEDKYTNLIHSTYHRDGGHFIAFEFPDALYTDFIQFVEKVVKIVPKA